MACVDINGLVLDQQSRLAIAEIATKKRLYKLLKGALIGGVLFNILNGRNKAAVIDNIRAENFQALIAALGGVNVIQKRELMAIADREFATRIPSKNRLFWENISNGCKD